MDIDDVKGDKDQDLRSFRKGRISEESKEQGGFCPHCGRGDRRKASRSA